MSNSGRPIPPEGGTGLPYAGAPAFFSFPYTTVSSTPELFARIGELEMELSRQRNRLFDLEQLAEWLQEQPMVFTASICCDGADLLRRIKEEMAKRDLACNWCAQGNPRVRSSVSDAWVHTDTPVGRVICRAPQTTQPSAEQNAGERLSNPGAKQ